MLIRKCLRGPDLTANQRAVLFWCLCPVCSYKQRGEKSGQWTQHLTDVWQSVCVCEGSDRGVFVSWFMRSVTIGQPWIYAPPLPNLPPNTHTHSVVRWPWGEVGVLMCLIAVVCVWWPAVNEAVDLLTLLQANTHTHTLLKTRARCFSALPETENCYLLCLCLSGTVLWSLSLLCLLRLISSFLKFCISRRCIIFLGNDLSPFQTDSLFTLT